MPDLSLRPDAIRWSSACLSAPPDVIETQLVLPLHLFLALENAAHARRMTVGQMARLVIGRGVRPADSTAPLEKPPCS